MERFKLDVRGLNHPEPLERSVEMMKRLEGKKVLHLLVHRYPTPLLMIAQKQGIRFASHETEEGEWHILFTKDPSLDLQTLLSEHCGV